MDLPQKKTRFSVSTKIMVPIVVVTAICSAITYFYFTSQSENSAVQAMVSQARTLVLEAEASREYATKQMKHNVFRTDLQNTEDILHTVPIFSAIQVAKNKAKELGITVKVPKFSPRNPDNQPDAFEAEVLQKLESGKMPESYAIDDKTNSLRYFRPIKLTQECLNCHGDPTTSQALWGNDRGLDITGAKMEGWKEGEVHGAFEVQMPLAPMQADLRSQTLAIALIALGSMAAIIIISVVFARHINSPLKRLGDASKEMSSGNYNVEVHAHEYKEVEELSSAFNVMTQSIRGAKTELQQEKDYLTQSVDTMLQGMSEFSKGNLMVKLQPKCNDEIGKLFNGFNETVSNIRSLVLQVQESTNETSAAARQINTSTGALASTMNEQTLQTSQIASAVEEMAATIMDNSRSISMANDQTTRANDIVNVSFEVFKVLADSSRQIGDIVSMIYTIADQTNLLALNAAIEAARAGEHGRGFAVVADEIRRLAEKTQEATKEITTKVHQIQQDSANSMDSMNAIAEVVTHLKEIVQAIATSSEEQSITSAEISSNLARVSSNAESINGSVNQYALTSEKLTFCAQSLEKILGDFQIEESRHSRGVHYSDNAPLIHPRHRNQLNRAEEMAYQPHEEMHMQ